MNKQPKITWSAWRFVAWFGVVSLLADLVYEGARSISGPFLASLGASAALIGVITGLGEAFALTGRLGSGPLADKTRAYWPLAIAGYGITVISVPLLGVASVLGVAAVLVVAERAGKALRSPAKDVMLSHATSAIGRGKGFAIHEALDQIGAILGPLAIGAILGITNSYSWAFGVLAIPGVAVIAMLLWLKRQVPNPAEYEPEEATKAEAQAEDNPFSIWQFPPAFWWYLAFTVVATLGYATFGVLSYHLVKAHVIATPWVPVVYAAAMGVDALVAVATGWAYDRVGRRSLLVVPFLSAAIPILAFTKTAWVAIAGILLWGAVMGVQESTMRAAVADLVPTRRRGTAYGVFAAGFGAATFIGGALTGFLYEKSISGLVITVAVIEVAALAVFLVALKQHTPQAKDAA